MAEVLTCQVASVASGVALPIRFPAFCENFDPRRFPLATSLPLYMNGIVMQDNGLDRRDFHKLTVAALGGVIAGTTMGCGNGAATNPAPVPSSTSMEAAATTLTDAEKLIIDEPHTCRGLNSCKNLGRSKENACAGQGTCASIADASCSGNNECKGQGGCGELPGMNACKGKGGCHIPLMESAWTKARASFEVAMKKSGKTIGAPPAKAKE